MVFEYFICFYSYKILYMTLHLYIFLVRISFLLWYSSSPTAVFLRHTGQWVSGIHWIWLNWSEYHFRLYYSVHLDNPLSCGKFKALSTCTNHLTAAAIFQGTILFVYFRLSSSYSLDQDEMTSLLYTLVIPMLNPLIYSLRNKDVKEALEKLKRKNWF